MRFQVRFHLHPPRKRRPPFFRARPSVPMPLIPSLRVPAVALTLFSMTAGAVIAADPVAFPGAEGYGRFASGGRGGEVYIVTNLNDSGPGSLRTGVASRTSAVPRTIVFAVSGTIYLQSTLRITQGNLTIAGQTAPGDGICLAYRPLDISNSTNVILRFLRVRLGDVAGVETDAFSSRYGRDLMIDHCSFSWSVDETSSTYDNTNLTLQWCFITESMRDSVHSKGAHGYGGIWGGLGATFHHNLLAHHDSRNPRFNGARTHNTDGELVDMRNNVIYNWRGNSTYGGEPTNTGVPARHNLVNNTYKNGPATSTGTSRYRILEPTRNALSTGANLSLFHITGNWTTASTAVTANNWNGGVQVIPSAEFPAMRTDTPFAAPAVVTQTAQASFPLVLAYAGCRVPARDVIDTRIAGEVTNGTVTFYGSKGNIPGIIDSQADVGGWPVLASTPAPTDSDADGMPDAWETARGLNPASAADRNLVDADGYTRLENYLNELAAPAFPLPTIASAPASAVVSPGAGLALSVTAAGVGPFAYQWYKNSVAIAGSTSASLVAAGVTADAAGSYHVVVTNPYGSVASAPAVVTVMNSPPTITSGPAALDLVAGQSAIFTVSVAGTAPFAFQWYKGLSPISGATAATYTIASVRSADAGSYRVAVSNASGSATSASAILTVAVSAGSAFATTFAGDTIHAASPALTGTSTNWFVMSSKNASTSSVGDDAATTGVVEARPLDLTMPITSSGVVEAAAFFAATPRTLSAVGDVLRARLVFVPTNVRQLGVGFFNSGGVPPHTGLINSLLVSTSTSLATGGTQNWRGYRAGVANASAAGIFEARGAQSGASNASQSLIVPGTSSSATAATIGTASSSPAALTFADGQTYTLTVTLTRSAAAAFTLGCTVHAGTDTTAAALFSSSAVTTASGALPADVTGAFDAIGIGYRNVGNTSVSRVTISSLRVDYEPLPVAPPPGAYASFLAAYGLNAAGNGAPEADADEDGVANALEFIQGGLPLDPASAPRPVCVAESATVAAFSFRRHLEAEGSFELVVEKSSDLVDWAPLVAGVGGVDVTVQPLDLTHEQVTVRAPIDGARVFFRLSATPR